MEFSPYWKALFEWAKEQGLAGWAMIAFVLYVVLMRILAKIAGWAAAIAGATWKKYDDLINTMSSRLDKLTQERDKLEKEKGVLEDRIDEIRLKNRQLETEKHLLERQIQDLLDNTDC